MFELELELDIVYHSSAPTHLGLRLGSLLFWWHGVVRVLGGQLLRSEEQQCTRGSTLWTSQLRTASHDCPPRGRAPRVKSRLLRAAPWLVVALSQSPFAVAINYDLGAVACTLLDTPLAEPIMPVPWEVRCL